ncbi:MAG: ThiF family adenylyltransferase [Acidimicrobiales bacterium]|jgi:hypothetical protein
MSAEPIHFREGTYGIDDLHQLRSAHPIVEEIDLLNDQLDELAAIRMVDPTAFLPSEQRELRGDWFYVPWTQLLIHLVTQAEFDELRTNRNRNIIRSDEQTALLNCRVAIAGLSIGANIALSLARSGIASTLRLADFDYLETTNLNRAPYPFYAVGRRKTQAVRRALFDITPFLDVELIEDGVTAESVADFCDSQDLVFDEIDDLRMCCGSLKFPTLDH